MSQPSKDDEKGVATKRDSAAAKEARARHDDPRESLAATFSNNADPQMIPDPRASLRYRRDTPAAADMQGFQGKPADAHRGSLTEGREHTITDEEEAHNGLLSAVNDFRTMIAQVTHDLRGGRSMSGDEALFQMSEVERMRKRKADIQEHLGLPVTPPPEITSRKSRPVIVKEEPADDVERAGAGEGSLPAKK